MRVLAARRIVALIVAFALAVGAAACGGDDDEEATAPVTTPTGTTGPTDEGGQEGQGGQAGGQGGGGEDEPGAEAQREGAGTGLEENLSGADVTGTEPARGGQATTGDTTP